MELVIKIKGKDIKDIKMTQNGKGEYMYSKVLGYPNVAMKDFEEVLLSVPKGYKKYSNGSHTGYLSQKAVDISSLGIATANKDFKVEKLYRQGIQSYVAGRFRIGKTNKWDKLVWFVHAANDYVSTGKIITAGKAIAECVHNHFHLFVSGADFWSWYLNQTPQYKKGDRLQFTDTMNYRSQKGQSLGEISKGAVCELKGDGVWGTVAGYTGWWYDADFLDKTGGQIADTSRNMQTGNPITNIDGTTPEPPNPCQKYIDTIESLEREIARLEDELRALEEALKNTLEVLEEVKAQNKELETENATLKEDKEFLVGLSTDLKYAIDEYSVD